MRLGFTWQFLKKKYVFKLWKTINSVWRKDTQWSTSLILWFFCRGTIVIFQMEECVVLVVSLVLTTGVTIPISLQTNGGWKCFSPFHCFSSLWGAIAIRCPVGPAAGFVVSLCSATPWLAKDWCKQVLEDTGLVSADGLCWCGNVGSSLWVFLRGTLRRERKQRRGKQSIYSISRGLD